VKTAGILLVVIIAGAAATGGYWYGSRGAQPVAAPSRNAATPQAAPPARKILYYRNPMGLPDTSPVPKKDPMGMDYVPVYDGDERAESARPNAVSVSTDKVQKLGVRTEAAALRAIDRMVRAAGRVAPDERRLYAISPKFEGYVERLFVNVTGQPVARGQPLFEVYSPDLVSAQREYAVAAQGVEALKNADSQALAGMRQLAQSSLLRLRNWDISEEQIRALAKSGEAKRTLTFRSPVAGIVTDKKALQGMRFMPGEALYQVADLSRIWVLADVFEQDIGWVKTGAQATLHINAYPERNFGGRITYVYPTLKSDTRTIPVRIELPNPGLLLKPDMYADVEIPISGKGRVVTVPASAVIDTGVRRIVLVQREAGRFEPREVKLGARGDNYVEVTSGVSEGEQVVVSANFLIDAESNLKAALTGFGSGAAQAAAAPTAATGHKGTGTVESVDAKAGTVSIAHGAIASLEWPPMTMEFKVANGALLTALQPHARVAFEFVERGPGEWMITAVTPEPVAAETQPRAAR
jgi:Cu(I)/Ag(I) efflux system membrane fusion protein